MNNIDKYHHTVLQITTLLDQHQVWYETFEHEPVRTSEEAAKTRPDYTIDQGAKAILIRVKTSNSEKKFAMLVLPGSARFDTNKVKTLFGAKDIRFASEEEVSQITGGIQPGGVPPFGGLFGLEVIVDPSIFNNEKIVFNAGDKRFSIGMFSLDYQTIAQPRIEQLL